MHGDIGPGRHLQSKPQRQQPHRRLEWTEQRFDAQMPLDAPERDQKRAVDNGEGQEQTADAETLTSTSAASQFGPNITRNSGRAMTIRNAEMGISKSKRISPRKSARRTLLKGIKARLVVMTYNTSRRPGNA